MWKILCLLLDVEVDDGGGGGSVGCGDHGRRHVWRRVVGTEMKSHRETFDIYIIQLDQYPDVILIVCL